MSELTSSEVLDLHLCHHCVGEDFFSREIKRRGTKKTCDYCKEKKKGLSIEAVADRIEEILAHHYQPANMEPNWLQVQMIKDREGSYDFYPEGESTNQLIEDLAQIPSEAANHIQTVLHDRHGDWDSWASGQVTPFADDQNYEEAPIDDQKWHLEWDEFERTLKTETRFFNKKGDDLLCRIFDGIESLKTRQGEDLIEDAGPGTKFAHLFRAREFQDETGLMEAMKRPDRLLGPPPSQYSSSGRMNAQGVAVFYGATEQQVAISEVRPAVGSQVLVGRFDIIRPLKLLNLSQLSGISRSGSLFDPVFSAFLERAKFLQSFSQQMTRTVLPSHEALDYLPTQAVADYLASSDAPPLDGIIFPSVQSGYAGKNVVLFHKASRVLDLDIPDGTELDAETWQMYNEGPQRQFSVTEIVPKPIADDEEVETAVDPWVIDDLLTQGAKAREPSLQMIVTELEVRIVERICYRTEDHKVDRSRDT